MTSDARRETIIRTIPDDEPEELMMMYRLANGKDVKIVVTGWDSPLDALAALKFAGSEKNIGQMLTDYVFAVAKEDQDGG